MKIDPQDNRMQVEMRVEKVCRLVRQLAGGEQIVERVSWSG